MAGDSADEVARRAREKADRLVKRAEMFEKGAEGERVVAALLAQLPPTWFVLNDIHWPGRQRANLDHVVVGPTGVFVIDAKNWSGKITVSRGVLRQNGYGRTKAIDGALAARSALAGSLPGVDIRCVVPVICFVGEDHVDGELHGVRLCSVDSLMATLQASPVRLSPELLQFLRFDLDMSSRPASEPYRPSPVSSPVMAMPPPPAWARVTPPPPNRHRASGLSKRRIIFEGIGLWFVLCMIVGVAFSASGHARDQSGGPVLLLVTVVVVALTMGRARKAD